ncbi:glycosyltransferase family 21 protein [Pluteus cervinus]|uniref:Glycosyltransferase family 21 protein n=1 Tax=Pluteus cervinus TaxID=181527 RepID=A0ACD3BGD5_9AGAR|nr:glycosyltransferase family 21 protein [Pluteus cervinus]
MAQPPDLDVSYAASVIGAIWYLALWAISLLGCWESRKRYRCRPRSPLASKPSNTVPGVSILRPLKGLDANLYENLETTFLQEYSNFEILFSVADERDQALSVVRELITKYPQVKAKIITGEEVVGVNPKINNLIRSYGQAAHDILWILDSNVGVDRGTLARAVDVLTGPYSQGHNRLGKPIALVHHVPFAVSSRSTIGSRIEEAFLNTNHAKMYVALNTLAWDSCVVGKSNLYRRSDLERVTGPHKKANTRGGDSPEQERGLRAFARYLAEDNTIANSLWHELDIRHDLSCDIARNVVENMTLSDYIWRRVRWIRVRRAMVLAATLLEPLTESVVLSLIGSASLRFLFSVPIWATLLAHYSFWLFVDFDVYTSLAGQPMPWDGRSQFLAAWAARELMALPIWLLAMCGNDVTWRGERYTMLKNGEVEKATSTTGWTRFWLSRRRDDYEPLATM